MNKGKIVSLLTAISILTWSPVYGMQKQADKEDGKLPIKYNQGKSESTTERLSKSEMKSAWAIAFIEALERNNGKLNGKEKRFSVNNLISTTSRDYSDSFDRGEKDTGTLAMAIGYAAAWEGPVSEKDDDGGLQSGLKADKHVQEVIFLPEREEAGDNRLIKEMIMKYGGVAASVWEEVETSNGYEKINDAVAIIGWDDEYRGINFREKKDGDGAFRVKRSDGSYGYISYYDITFGDKLHGEESKDISMSVATRIDPVDNYDHIYQHDPLGYTKKYTGENGNSAFFVNVFNIEDRTTVREKLKAVSFYTLEEDLDYEIYIRYGFKSVHDIKKMKVIKKGNMKLPGYHTVDLEINNVLFPGRNVAIGVKLISKNGTPSIALEAPHGLMRGDARGDSGESYMRDEDGSMVDITAKFENTNACIKIFTDEIIASSSKVLSSEEMKEDLDYILQSLNLPNDMKGEMAKEYQEIYKMIETPKTEREFYVIAKRLLALNKDETAYLADVFKDKFMDISVKWLARGMIIDETRGDFHKGDEIVEIGGLNLEEFMGNFKEILSSDNEYGVRYKAERFLKSKNYMDYLGLLNEDETLDIKVERGLEYKIIRGEFSLLKEEEPKQIEDVCSWNIEKENGIGYLKIDRWISREDDGFKEAKESIDNFFGEVNKDKVKNIAIDIRNAEGDHGDLFDYILKYIEHGTLYRDGEYKLDEYLNGIEKNLIFKDKVYIMTSNKISRGSILAASLMQGNDLATVIGEQTGLRPDFTMEEESKGTLPNRKWEFGIPVKRPDKIRGVKGDLKTLKPDIIVETRRIDILANRDIQLEALRENVSGKKSTIYKRDSINIENGERMSFFYSEYDSHLRFDDKFKFLKAPFKMEDVKQIYLKDTQTHEEIPVEVEKAGEYGGLYHSQDEIIIPEDLGSQTYQLIFKMKNRGKEYKMLLNVIEKSKWDATMSGKIYDRKGNLHDAPFTKYYREVRDDMKFFLENESSHLTLQFKKELAEQNIGGDVTLTQHGEMIEIKKTWVVEYFKMWMFVFFKEQLPPGDGYEMVIPKNTIKFKDGTKYEDELKMRFIIPKVNGAVEFIFYDPDRKTFMISGNQPMKCEDLSKLELRDSKGELVKIRSKKISKYEPNFFIKYEGNANLKKEHTLIIPAGAIDFKFTGKNKEPLIYKFKYN